MTFAQHLNEHINYRISSIVQKFLNKKNLKNKLLKSKRDLGVEEHESVEALLK